MGKLVFITIERLLEMQANEEKFKLVEVLPEQVYNEGHFLVQLIFRWIVILNLW